MLLRKGFVLVLAIFFLAIMQLIAIAVTGMSLQESWAGGRYAQEVGAWCAADAGIQDCLAFMETELEAGREPALNPRSGQLGEFRWEVTIDPDAETFPKGNSSLRSYTLISAGNSSSSITRKLRTVVAQRPFTRYARFINRWPNPQPVTDTVFFWGGRIFVDGPVHSNEHLWIHADSELYSKTGAYSTLFYDGASSVREALYSGISSPPGSDPEFRAVFNTTDRRRTPRRVSPVTVPSLAYLAERAWGGPVSGVSPGVNFRHSSGGGIYVQGNVDSYVMESAPPVSRHIFVVGGQTYRVEEDWAANVTHYWLPGASANTTASGKPTCFYVDGSILNLRGVHHGNHTLAVNTDVPNSIVVGGPITNTTASGLGLVTYYFRFPPESVLSRGPYPVGSPMAVHAAVFAVGKDSGGGALVDDFDAGGLGEVFLHGSLIEGRRRVLAVPSLGTGWNLQVRFDDWLKRYPPPYFPATSKLTVRATFDEN